MGWTLEIGTKVNTNLKVHVFCKHHFCGHRGPQNGYCHQTLEAISFYDHYSVLYNVGVLCEKVSRRPGKKEIIFSFTTLSGYNLND